MTGWTSRLAIVAATAMVLAACGGGGSDPVAETTGTTLVAPTETTGAPEPDDNDAEPPANTETDESYAKVTTDGTTYEFGENGPAATCNPNFFGGFFAVLYTEDVSTGTFQVELWNEGVADDRPTTAGMTVEVDGTKLDLEANPERSWPAVEDGTSFVESFSYEGNRAEGTASFIDSQVAFNADLLPLDPILADFEVVCAE